MKMGHLQNIQSFETSIETRNFTSVIDGFRNMFGEMEVTSSFFMQEYGIEDKLSKKVNSSGPLRSLQPLLNEISKMSDIRSIFRKNVSIRVVHIF